QYRCGQTDASHRSGSHDVVVAALKQRPLTSRSSLSRRETVQAAQCSPVARSPDIARPAVGDTSGKTDRSAIVDTGRSYYPAWSQCISCAGTWRRGLDVSAWG